MILHGCFGVVLKPCEQAAPELSALLSFGLICLLLSPSSLLAQIPEPAPAAQPANSATRSSTTNGATTLQSDTDEVSIDLVVRDKKNRPITDLNASELAVTDAGIPVQLSGMHLVTAQSGAEARITMVFDQLSSSSAKNAREIAEKLVGQSPTNGISFAVLGLDGRLRLFQNFAMDHGLTTAAINLATSKTSISEKRPATTTPAGSADDAEKQLISIAQTGTSLSGANASVQDRNQAQLMLTTLEESQRIIGDQHAQPVFAGLLALTKMQQKMAGRKVILYFAEGLRADSNMNDMVQSVVKSANRSGISIYTIDTNGLNTRAAEQLSVGIAMASASSTGFTGPTHVGTTTSLPQEAPGLVAQAGNNITRLEGGGLDSPSNPLAALAVGTGGFYISAGDSWKKPLQRLMTDITTYYEATYTPTQKDYDGEFHPISIQPLRVGVSVRSRAGYFALPPDAVGSSALRPFEAPLAKILGDPQMPVDVVFQQSVLRLGGNSSRSLNALVIEVPISNLDVREDINTKLYSVHASIMVQVKDKSGVVLEHFSEEISRHGALETVDAARSDALTMQRHFTAAPGTYVLEAALLDHLSGKTGGKRIEFTIPPTTGDPWLSEIALVRRTEPFRGTPDVLEPLQYSNARIVPNLSGQVPSDAKQVSLFFTIHPQTKSDVKTESSSESKLVATMSAQEKGALRMEVFQGEKSLAQTPLEVPLNNTPTGILYMATLQAKSLPAGTYKAVFTYEQGGKTARREEEFHVAGNELAISDSSKSGPGISVEDSGDTADSSAGESGMLVPLASTRFTPDAALMGANKSSKPSKLKLDALLEGARRRSLSYGDTLPNFKCIEVTERFNDHSGKGIWKHRDTIAELLGYNNHIESRKILEINGLPSKASVQDLKGMQMRGEFGSVLNAVFNPDYKAEFQWKETDSLGSGSVEVFTYKVALKNSNFSLTDSENNGANVGIRGLVYIDTATRGVRRITLNADEMPARLRIHAASVTIDYDYIAINNHDYLMPVHGELSLQQGKHEAILNRVEFRDYHRFGSQSSIVSFTTP